MRLRKPKSPIPVPPRVRSLIGMRFGRLVVQHYAGADKHGKSHWCCLCDCGALCRVPGGRLLGWGKEQKHTQKSCGCLRADPGVRAAARLKVPAAKRAEICQRAQAAVRRRQPPYALDAHRAAELLGVSYERVEILAKDGLLGSTYRRGALFVSSSDVATLLSTQERNKRHCRTIEEWEASLVARRKTQ